MGFIKKISGLAQKYVPRSSTVVLANDEVYEFYDSRGNVQVAIQDQFTEIIDLKMATKLDDLTLLNNYSVNDTTIDVETTGVTPTLNDTICLKDLDGVAFYQGTPLEVTNLGANQYRIKLDTPLDFAFGIDDGCSLTNTNLAVDGSTTPVVFAVTPAKLAFGTKWDINRIMISFAGTGEVSDPQPDDTSFGTIPAINKGLVLRTVNGVTKNVFNVKTNGALRQRCGGDLIYVPASKTGLYAVHGRRTFNGQEKNGVSIRLGSQGETGDQIQLIVQDDLTDMEIGEAIIQGHVVD